MNIDNNQTIPITYYQIKSGCGWSKWCDVTGGNHYSIKEFGEFENSHLFYATKKQAKELRLIN